uniref:Uncharacterized LOC103394580 n=1 Tax=Cynoglossus semilaevis TaxID=244447 RepID=A0A3P8WDR7_CYNSE
MMALVTADQMVHRLGPGVGGLVQSVDPNDELVLTIQRILRGEIPDVDSEEIWKILEESPNSSAPAVPAETRSNSQPQAVDPVGSGRRPLGAALHSLQQPAAAEQAAPALCRQLPHSHTVVLSGGQQNDQAGDHSQGQDLAPSRPSVSRPGKGSEASASGAPQEHPEDELVLITQKMFREDMPHIDFDVLRQLLEESPNPLLPPPAPVFVGQPRSAQSVSSSSASLTADTLFAAEPATPAVYPVPLHNPTLAMAEGHYNELMSDDSQSQDHVDSSVGTETDSSAETSEQEDELTLITQRMLRGEILDIDSEEIRNILGESPDPLTAASGFKVPALGVGCTPMTAAPHGFQQPMTVAGGRMAPPLCHQPPHSQTVVLSGGHQNGHGATHSHRQYLSNQCPVYNSLGGAGGSLSPAYLQNQSQRLVFTPLAAAGNDASTSFMSLKLPQGVLNMPAVGVVNGEVVYEVPPDVTLSYVNLGPAAQNSALPNKKRRECKGLDEQPYVKKPPNAFMLFMREHRAKVAAEHSAAANAVLGLMWKSLSKDEQKKYRDEADQERIKHILQFPQWSCKDNYGKKRRRIRKKSPNITLATLSDPDVTQTVVLETSASQDYSDCE